MCRQLEYLVYRNNWQYVAICEHGTVHLTWQRTTLHLSCDDFRQIASFIYQTQEMAEMGKYYACAQNALAMDERGYYQIWLMGTGFYLSTVHFTHFLAMVNQALVMLERYEAAASVTPSVSTPPVSTPPVERTRHELVENPQRIRLFLN